jgi:hypothetical protein
MSFPTPLSPFQMAADAPLNKRRRFEPEQLFTIPTYDNTTIIDQTFDSPLIQELADRCPLPEEIEASLLQVGMRVRKAVPEGYKTMNTFRPRPFFNMHKLSPQTQAALLHGQQRNELNPYYSDSNVHNVGGLSQPISTATFCGINLASMAAREASSQTSWGSPGYSYEQSQMWNYSTSHKRSFNDSDSDDSDEWLPQTPTLDADMGLSNPIPADYFAIDIENMSDVSPMTQVRETRHPPARRVAKPVSKINKKQQAQPTSAFNPFAHIEIQQEQQHHLQQAPSEVNINWGMDFGFGPPTPQQLPTPQQQQPFTPRHHRVLSCGIEASMSMNAFDFGEAGFLARREDVEMDCS